MKKNKTMRAAALMLALTLVTSCFVGGTFAKYTSEATGTDSARVALWSFEVNDTQITATDEFTFNLFNTVYDTRHADNRADADVTPTDGTIIAPGTKGSFDIKLENLSEVSAKYAIDYTVTNTAGIPIQFSVDGGNTWSSTLTDVAASDDVKLAAGSGTTTITVQWQWAYEQADVTTGDAADTALGIKGTDTVTVAAKVTATQID